MTAGGNRAVGDVAESRDSRRRDDILAAAETLFLRYGVRRTSMDDIATEAGIAKGTVYLSFRSKEELFVALTERMTTRFLADARAAMAAESDCAGALTAFLAGAIGAPGLLLYASPHAAELFESKLAHAARIIADYDATVEATLRQRLRQDGITAKTAPVLFLAAAHGCKKTSGLDAAVYRHQLNTLVETILAGLQG
jgi:AcrR family transcriptional regulator